MSFFTNNFSANRLSASVFLGGELQNEALAREIASKSTIFVCADSGAEHARRLGLTPHAIVGDLDSVTLNTLTYFEELNCEIIRNTDQESNDFDKALAYIMEQFQDSEYSGSIEGCGNISVFGMTGGRTDHSLSNFSVMLRYSDRFESIVAIESGAEHRFLTAHKNNCQIECDVGTTISLIPFGEANGIVTQNLAYPLSRETLSLGVREGVSNISTGSPVSVSIDIGSLLVTVAHNV